MTFKSLLLASAVSLALAGCSSDYPEQQDKQAAATTPAAYNGKPVVYQTLTRLFGNTNTSNVQWGTLEQNGVGKFSDFTPTALAAIKELGTTHIWYTGVPHHAVIRDYTEFGISLDDPDVVKGRAGSPYAVKDYYNVDPDLADDVNQRLAEFEALIQRTHDAGMQVIIDIVPNHVARDYQSLSAPEGVEDFGASDDTSVEYARDNNFYYLPGQDFIPPTLDDNITALGGEAHPLADGKFDESPAKWTGNGARSVQPDQNDWYETVKINYGVKPDGSYDFPTLPADYAGKSYQEHLAFWRDVDVPDSWEKYRDITLYWIDKGVDGFRFDVAEMVPVEFWSYLNSHIKQANPDAFLLAEIYNPSIYRDFIHLGKMDYLYDKVGTYDLLRDIIEGDKTTDELAAMQASLLDIDPYMLRFLENHDEQRIASPAFAGDARKAKPAMVYTALIGKNATMLYFGQEVAEPGEGDLGFGDPTRTTLFDYAGVPAHQRWMNDGKFDGGQLSEDEKALREFHVRLLNVSRSEPAFAGDYQPLHAYNRSNVSEYNDQQFAFARWDQQQKVVVVSNFAGEPVTYTLQLPAELVSTWSLAKGKYAMGDLLSDTTATLSVADGTGKIAVSLPAYGSLALALKE